MPSSRKTENGFNLFYRRSPKVEYHHGRGLKVIHTLKMLNALFGTIPGGGSHSLLFLVQISLLLGKPGQMTPGVPS